jgi:hypothetical protein
VANSAVIDDVHEIDVPVQRRSDALPDASVSILDDDGIEIHLERLADDMIYDQGVATASGQGCISSPGGPRC